VLEEKTLVRGENERKIKINEWFGEKVAWKKRYYSLKNSAADVSETLVSSRRLQDVTS
jgi:hypothetical protein